MDGNHGHAAAVGLSPPRCSPVAGASGWMLYGLDFDAPATAQGSSDAPEAYMENFVTVEMDGAGEPQRRIEADYMAYLADETVELTNPRYVLFRAEGEPWHVRSERGQVSADGTVLLLLGKVEVWRNDASGGARPGYPDRAPEGAARLRVWRNRGAGDDSHAGEHLDRRGHARLPRRNPIPAPRTGTNPCGWTPPRIRECNRRAKGWLGAALLLASVTHAHALSTDRDQPIAIQADRAEHDDVRRITIYRGNVIIDQGSLHITGDTVTIHFDTRDEVSKITSVGAPAHFRQLPDDGGSPRKAWAKQMEHFPEQDLIVLFGDARYDKDGSPRAGGSARIRFAQRAFQGADGHRGRALGGGRSGRREETGACQDSDQAEEEAGAVEVRWMWRRPGELPRTNRQRPSSPRAGSRNATVTVSSSTM